MLRLNVKKYGPLHYGWHASMARISLAVVLGCMLALHTNNAAAWGALGHRVVAQLAMQQLDTSARKEVKRLLATGTKTSLVNVSPWPDQIRHQRQYKKLWQRTRKQHYINFSSRHCRYKPARQCADGQCVVAGIDHYAAILKDRHASDSQRRQALIFVTHFVADVHQPLHAGYRHDAGGNAFSVLFRGKKTNLHRVWDSLLLYTYHEGWRKYAARLTQHLPRKRPPVQPPAAAVTWAEASCRLSRHIYPSSRKIGKAYIKTQRPVADRQLIRASRHLAGLLDKLL